MLTRDLNFPIFSIKFFITEILRNKSEWSSEKIQYHTWIFDVIFFPGISIKINLGFSWLFIWRCSCGKTRKNIRLGKTFTSNMTNDTNRNSNWFPFLSFFPLLSLILFWQCWLQLHSLYYFQWKYIWIVLSSYCANFKIIFKIQN